MRVGVAVLSAVSGACPALLRQSIVTVSERRTSRAHTIASALALSLTALIRLDVYFKVGSNREPNQNGIIIPDELGRYYGHRTHQADTNCPLITQSRLHKLSKYSGQNLLLTLPRTINSKEVRWLSLWSNTFAVCKVVLVFMCCLPNFCFLGEHRPCFSFTSSNCSR